MNNVSIIISKDAVPCHSLKHIQANRNIHMYIYFSL